MLSLLDPLAWRTPCCNDGIPFADGAGLHCCPNCLLPVRCIDAAAPDTPPICRALTAAEAEALAELRAHSVDIDNPAECAAIVDMLVRIDTTRTRVSPLAMMAGAAMISAVAAAIILLVGWMAG